MKVTVGADGKGHQSDTSAEIRMTAPGGPVPPTGRTGRPSLIIASAGTPT
ncbi:hypothetical protein [Micromonospora sp. KC213]|nr:hypothetical protein [Micromonospora sp. KC213]